MSEYSHTSQTPEECYRRNCTVVTYQSANVSVPITIRPRVNTGDITAFCCGEPKIIPSSYIKKLNPCINSTCSFTISQDICVEIPVEFSAEAYAGPPHVICGEIRTGK
jgi:hypothetical protein